MTTAPTTQLTPRSPEALAEMLLQAREEKRQLVLEDNLSVSCLDKVLKYKPADLTLKVQSGITMGQLYAETQQHGQTFPLTYPGDMRLIDVLGADEPAPETGVLGYPRDYVLCLEIATPDGALTKCGGEVVKNVTGYDLAKLYVGSRHTLGVITSVALKLTGLPETSVLRRMALKNPQAGFDIVKDLLDEGLPLQAGLLLQQKNKWELLLKFSGYKMLSEQAVKSLKQKTTPLEPVEMTAAWFAEGSPPLRVEAVFPAAGQAVLLEKLSSLPSAPGTVCINPVAGICRINWANGLLLSSEEMREGLRQLSHELHACGGFLQLLDFPETLEFKHLVEELNLPADEVNRQLMKRFKEQYDPAGVLYSRVLPL